MIIDAVGSTLSWRTKSATVHFSVPNRLRKADVRVTVYFQHTWNKNTRWPSYRGMINYVILAPFRGLTGSSASKRTTFYAKMRRVRIAFAENHGVDI